MHIIFQLVNLNGQDPLDDVVLEESMPVVEVALCSW
jgi:hypothetical protein